MKNVFVFLEASLETVPKVISKHPEVLSDARRRKKKPTEMILDDSKHHNAMKKLKNREKRGRPDIIHQCLLLLLDSPIKKDFDIYVHTINNEIIYVNSETRLPRNYNRFIGLMEDLFKKRKIVANGKTLLEMTDLSLRRIVEGREVVVLHERGEGEEVLYDVFKRNFAVCIGAFPHGDFSRDVLRILGKAKFVSFGVESYTSLYVTCRVISIYERVRFD